MNGRVERSLVVAGIAGAALAVTASMSAAAAGGTPVVRVKGTQTIVNEAKGQYEMHGSLVGKWNTTAFTLHYAGAEGDVAATGKEIFIGCQDTDGSGTCDPAEPKGTMRFTFVYWANYKPGTETLIKGQCVHPVIGGTGSFKAAKGVLIFKDTPKGKEVLTTYTGVLELKAAARSAGAPASRSLASRASRPACGG